MADTAGPATLKELAAALRACASPEAIDTLLDCAEAWQTERRTQLRLAQQVETETAAGRRLAAQLRLLEQDRKGWKENSLKRLRRSAARRSDSAPRGKERT